MDNSACRSAGLLDKTAVTLSGLCLLHCLALPIVLASLPFLGQLANDHLHVWMLIIVIPVSVVAFLLGFRRHHNRGVLWIGGVGMSLLIIGGTVGHWYFGLAADRTLTIAGALVLAVAHFRNNRLTRPHSPAQT